ncbi:hypothetical protein KKC83_04560 [Patescibacteria group bacterium]|nr:hypothetical protein [Candidatus Falkowbacteria bacterium]MBU3906029.1 hypothetical protein [Patescibacteria group bacterium]MCG2698336.1 hypothetical protein [Candidatus Parcubacteria bacterium]MBU4015102.1 hypothetical protein [Patescibacteria group bacterium]MBU4026788.1 hypothetical protein [Patescibacteria group bacterium]
MALKYNLTTIGRWALIGGIAFAVLAGFAAIPYLLVILFVLGLIVGFLNVKEKESIPFLVAVITLLLIGVGGLQLGKLTLAVASILENFIAFIAAAGLVVAIKQVIVVAKPTSQE